MIAEALPTIKRTISLFVVQLDRYNPDVYYRRVILPVRCGHDYSEQRPEIYFGINIGAIKPGVSHQQQAYDWCMNNLRMALPSASFKPNDFVSTVTASVYAQHANVTHEIECIQVTLDGKGNGRIKNLDIQIDINGCHDVHYQLLIPSDTTAQKDDDGKTPLWACSNESFIVSLLHKQHTNWLKVHS